jgi:hypothetical protein
MTFIICTEQTHTAGIRHNNAQFEGVWQMASRKNIAETHTPTTSSMRLVDVSSNIERCTDARDTTYEHKTFLSQPRHTHPLHELSINELHAAGELGVNLEVERKFLGIAAKHATLHMHRIDS